MRVAGNIFYTIKLRKNPKTNVCEGRQVRLSRLCSSTGSVSAPDPGGSARVDYGPPNQIPPLGPYNPYNNISGRSQDDPRGVVWPLSGLTTPPRGGVQGGEGVSLLFSLQPKQNHGVPESVTCSCTSLSQASAGCK